MHEWYVSELHGRPRCDKRRSSKNQHIIWLARLAYYHPLLPADTVERVGTYPDFMEVQDETCVGAAGISMRLARLAGLLSSSPSRRQGRYVSGVYGLCKN
ncbi:hypothetical protein J6590_040000 [Homalodisca vitripennis]|nr:hypothetical protein J6590_040000 [Homalodisca vitripennis]